LWFAVLLVAPCLIAQDQVEGTSGWVFTVVPEANFYPHYIADPIRAQSALAMIAVIDSDIPETGSGRFALRLGGRFPIIRYHPAENPEIGWQLDFEGGYFGHFDMEHSLDNIGWDGVFGLLASWRPRPGLGLRFGTLHDSAHIGDEYAERTGQSRVGYTREELVLGVSWSFAGSWRVYGEGGHVYSESDHPERPWRIQAGLEYQGRRAFNRGRMFWYAALDLRAYEENDWRPRMTGQLGLMLPWNRGTARYRFALEVADGRTALGNFFLDEESYVGIGWYLDF
jgi:hypothetical protein